MSKEIARFHLADDLAVVLWYPTIGSPNSHNAPVYSRPNTSSYGVTALVELNQFKIQHACLRAHDHHVLLLQNVMPTFLLKANIKLPANPLARPTTFPTKELMRVGHWS